MRMGMDVNIRIDNIRQICQPVNLSALFASAAGTVGYIERIQKRSAPFRVIADPNEQKRRCLSVLIWNPQLSAHDLSHINSVRFVNSVFMVSGCYAKDLVLDRLKYLHALFHLLHRLEVCAIGIADAGCNRRIHKVAI